jgi:hypothetical protein
MRRMDPHERATSCWYRVAGLVSPEQKELAIDIIEAEIRSGQHEMLPEAARLVIRDQQPIELAWRLRSIWTEGCVGNENDEARDGPS